jgi:hypothetical protein
MYDMCMCVCVKNKGMKTKYIHNLFPNVSTCAYILVDTIVIHSKLKIFGLKQTALCIEKYLTLYKQISFEITDMLSTACLIFHLRLHRYIL